MDSWFVIRVIVRKSDQFVHIPAIACNSEVVPSIISNSEQSFKTLQQNQEGLQT